MGKGMLAKRIIPTMLVRGRTLVKGQQFNSWRSIGHAAQAARIHAARGVDELMILDISATAEGRGPDLGLVRELSEGCFIPITVGGGVKNVAHVDALLRAGADKVCINSGMEDMDEMRRIRDRFGKQAIVASIDFADTDVIQGVAAIAAVCEEVAGEILLTCIQRDGMMTGYKLDAIREVSAAVDIPVIASGGCGTYEHMLEAFQAGADACASGAMFAFTDATPKGAASFLRGKGLEMRL